MSGARKQTYKLKRARTTQNEWGKQTITFVANFNNGFFSSSARFCPGALVTNRFAIQSRVPMRVFIFISVK